MAQKVDPTLDYVVVGRLGNKNWKYRNYGKKIEEALYINSLTEQGKEIDKKYFRGGRSNTTIKIVTEDAWFKAFKNPLERTTPNNHNIFWNEDEITKTYLSDRTINCDDFIQRLCESAKNPRVEASINWIDDIRPYIEDCMGGQVSQDTTFKKQKDIFEIFNKKQYVVSVAYNKYEGEVIDFVLPDGSLAEEAFSTRDQYQEFLKELKGKLG